MVDFDQLVDDNQQQPNNTPQSFDSLVDDSEKFKTGKEQFKTALEGAGEGVAGPLSTAFETKLLGVKPEDISARAEANPEIHTASKIAGLVGGTMIPGLGEYSLGSKIAEAGVGAAKLFANPIAQGAAKVATEMALMQAADEGSKWLQNDPNQSIQSAIANVGLSAALGGVGGAAFSKAGQALKSLLKNETPAEVNIDLKNGFDPFTKEPFIPSNRVTIESSGVGGRIAQAIKDNAVNAGLEGVGASLGAAAGHASGIPGAGWIGAYIGKEHIAPVLKSIIPAIGKRIMDMDINPLGFATAVNTAEAALKGRLLVEKAANSVFQGDLNIESPSKTDIKELDAKIQNRQNNPLDTQAGLTNNLDHYMPDHAMSLGETVGNTVQYLNSLRPNTEKQSPLDSQPVADPIAQSNYERALELAQQPLQILKDLKDSTITGQDVKHVMTMYPALYDQMRGALVNSMTNHISKGKDIPYSKRMDLSLFTQQPLDSSMKPNSIQASMPAPQQIPQGAPNAKNVKHSTQKLGTLASIDATPSQARELRKAQKA